MSSAIGGGLTAEARGFANGIVKSAVIGALTNAATQGIGVVTGLQHSFNWTSVAATGAAAGLAQGIDTGLSPELGHYASDAVGRLAGAEVSNQMDGGRISSLVMLTDAFGNAEADQYEETPDNGARYRANVLDFGPDYMPPMAPPKVGGGGNFGTDAYSFQTWTPPSSVNGASPTVASVYNPLANGLTLPVQPGAIGPNSYQFTPINGSVTVQPGESYASVARDQLGDERYAGLLMQANGVGANYSDIHHLLAASTLSLPDLSQFSDDSLAIARSSGAQLLSADQLVTNRLNALRAQFASFDFGTGNGDFSDQDGLVSSQGDLPSPVDASLGGGWSAADLNAVTAWVLHPGENSGPASDPASGYQFQKTMTTLPWPVQTSSYTDVRGGFDDLGAYFGDGDQSFRRT